MIALDLALSDRLLADPGVWRGTIDQLAHHFTLRPLSQVDGLQAQKAISGCIVEQADCKNWESAASDLTLPQVSVEQLADPMQREIFFEQIYVQHRWSLLWQSGAGAKELVDFHARHKYQLMSRGQHHYRRLGRLIAEAGRADLPRLAQEYGAGLMQVLQLPTSRGRHVDVMLHLLGYLKHQLASGDKQALIGLIERYHHGLVARSVPLALLRQHASRSANPYLQRQYYFAPFPLQLMS